MKRIACALAALALTLAACSGDDAGPVATDAEPAAATPTLTAAATTASTTLPTTPVATTTAATPAATTTTTATPSEPDDADAGNADADTGDSEPLEDEPDPLSALVLNWMAETGTPGVVLAVTNRGATPNTWAWGLSDVATESPMTNTHIVRIGSVTKPVTAAVILQLVAEGLVDLDAPVAQYLGEAWAPGYEHADAVTVRDLLGHTSGFVEYALDPKFYVLAAPRLDVPVEPEEIMAFASEYGPVADLHTEYHYNTTGYIAAGLLIEAVTGNSAADEIRSRVLDPIGLANTYLTPNEFPPEPTSNGYVGGALSYVLGQIIGVTPSERVDFDGASLVDVKSLPQEFARSAGWTGGGLEARIGDVALLIRGLFADDVLTGEQIALMTAPHPDSTSNYGLGIRTDVVAGLPIYTHGGGVPGFRTMAAYVPALDLGVAISANLLGVDADADIDTLLESLATLLATA